MVWRRWLVQVAFQWRFLGCSKTNFNSICVIAAFFLIANFNSLMAAVVNSLLIVLRQIRRALSFIAQCVFQGASVARSGPKSGNLDKGNLAKVPMKDGVRMSAKETVVRKWGMD